MHKIPMSNIKRTGYCKIINSNKLFVLSLEQDLCVNTIVLQIIVMLLLVLENFYLKNMTSIFSNLW